MIKSLQAGRGIAALLVVLFHTQGIFQAPRYWGGSPLGDAFDFGYSGVHFFFVLSGFIIAFAHSKDLGRPERLGHYAWQRFTRVYPIYWLVLSVVLAAYFALPSLGTGSERSVPVIAGSFSLLPFAGTDAVLGVAWTLFHEILFYALFALLIIRPAIGIAAFGLWLAQFTTPLGGLLPSPLHYIANPINLLFFIGMACFAIYNRFKLPFPVLIGTAGAIAFVVVGRLTDFDNSKWENIYIVLGYGLAAAATILGFAEAERSNGLTIPKPLVILGSASYSLYLVHYPLLSLFAKVALWAGLRDFPLVAYALLVIGSVIAGLLCHFLVERPVIALIRKRQPRRAEAAPV